ncbi:MAG: hypothetical protein M3032_08555 [Verrucomicrobiota bacterium]|nr:hypothetical protein [Verrucomicrobiota bacterium]
MKLKIAFLFVLASAVSLSVSFAADDPFMGTWKFNAAKSKIPNGAPHNDTVVYAQSGDQVKVTVDGVDGSGKATHSEWTGKLDGKDYAAKGIASHDSRAYTKVDAHTLTYIFKKGGKSVGHGKVVVAADGKSRTVTETATGPDGKEVDTTSVFDKQ